MRILVLLIAVALCGLAQEKLSIGARTMDGSECVTGYDKNGALTISPCPPSLESRIEKLEKAVEKLTAKPQYTTDVAQPSAYLPTSQVTIWDAASRTTRILTLAEANALLVALANAINDASAQRATESGNEANTVNPGAIK